MRIEAMAEKIAQALDESLTKYIKYRADELLRAKGKEISTLKQRVDDFEKPLIHVEKKVGIR